MSRANEESKTKSSRSKANWERKQQAIISQGKIATKMMPAWLEIKGEKIVAIPAKAKTIKRIFALALKGYGIGLMTRAFNRENLPPIGRGDRWHSTYIHSILRNRSVVGEFIPHKFVGGKRTPAAPPVKGYYPKLIDEETFEAVNALLLKRRSRKYGGPSSKHLNIWNGLLYDEKGEPYTTYEKKSRFQRVNNCEYRCIVSLGALLGKSKNQINLRLQVFEAAIFDVLLGRFEKSFSVQADETDDETNTLRAKLASIDGKIVSVQEQALASDANVSGVVALLGRLEKQRAETERAIKESVGTAVLTDSDRQNRMMETYRALVKGKLDYDRRAELQAVIRQMVKKITLTLERAENTIEGKCFIEMIVGEPIQFSLTYDPYTNDREQDPVQRAEWTVIDGGKVPLHQLPLSAKAALATMARITKERATAKR